MSIGPIPGNGIPITIPAGKIVIWSAVAQAGFQQFAQLKNSSGGVVFTAQGNSSGPPNQYGRGSFVASDPSTKYTMWIGINGGATWTRVFWEQDVLNIGTALYAGKYIFAAEDAGDGDFNDNYIELTWFTKSG